MKILPALFFALTLAACWDRSGKPTPPPPATDTVALLKQRILKDSLNPELWQQLYEKQMEKGDSAGAIGSLTYYTSLAPENGDAWLTLAWLLAARKDPQALTVADSLLNVPDPAIRNKALYMKGLYYENSGQPDKALAIFDSVIVRNYTFTDAYMEKGVILHDQGKYEQALKTFQQAFLIRKNDPDIFLWISRCYAGLGYREEAEDWRKKYEALSR
jgi:tetratricopeptide (TPR) repeat protein